MLYFQEEIKKVIQKKYPDLEILFSTSPNVETGHLSIPCFGFSKILRRSPKDIAEEFSESIKLLTFIDNVEAIGGYINCFIKKEILFKTIISEVLQFKETYGSNQSGYNKTALIEHTSINPNASPHVGRARNAMIGASILRLLRFEG